MDKKEIVYILFGSNLNDRENNLIKALTALEQIVGLELVECSSIYNTKAVDMPEGSPDFLNQAVKIEYKNSPDKLLKNLKSIETSMGRTNKTKVESRDIDLDILLFGDQTIDQPDLKIPHPELLNRSFAIVPLMELDSALIHPVKLKPIISFLKEYKPIEISRYKEYAPRTIKS